MMAELSGTGEVINASRRFKKENKTLNPDAQSMVSKLKDKAIELEELILLSGETRETSLALTKLEEAIFWCEKHFNR